MAEHKEDANAVGVGSIPVLGEPISPLCPAPMPRKTLLFWTRLMVTAAQRSIAALCRPQRAMRPATVNATRTDEEPR
jgi:hypothetical protein